MSCPRVGSEQSYTNPIPDFITPTYANPIPGFTNSSINPQSPTTSSSILQDILRPFSQGSPRGLAQSLTSKK